MSNIGPRCPTKNAAKEPLEEFAKLLFGPTWRNGLILMAAVYFDESESHRPRDVFALAGCVSTTERWIAFKEMWAERLAKDNVRYFHTTDWARRKPPFDQLTDQKHEALGRDLCKLIEGQSVLHCVMEVIPARFYREMFVPQLHDDALMAYKDPYFFCFLSCLTHISVAQQNGILPNERVECFFERRDPKRDQRLMREYERVRGEFFPGKFGIIASGTKEDPEMLPCQAADLIVYQSMKRVRAKYGRPDDLPSIDLYALSDKGKLSGGLFSQPQQWKKYLDQVKAHQARRLLK